MTLKNYTARLLAKGHSADNLHIGQVLPFLTAEVSSTEAKMIATYDFVKLIGDGERLGEWCLDVSTKTIRAWNVWTSLEYRGNGTTIAILDSGMNETHPSLAGKIINHIDYTGTGHGDSADHGTHTAGIAAGTGGGSYGNIYSGVAPEAALLNVKVGGAAGPNATYVAWGIDWAVDNGADVISMSFSLGPACDGTQCTICTLIESATEIGVTVVVAAGNFGALGGGSVTYPGCCEEAITVGAINDHNTESMGDDGLCGYSGRGPTLDGRIKPDVVAPAGDPGNIMSPNAAGGYSNFGGTSAATPHVAGVAALLLQAHPGWTQGIVKSVIMGTARLNDNLQSLTENDRGKKE